MKAAELRTLSDAELEEKGRELRNELFNAKIRHRTGQLENTALLRQLRTDVARVETLLTQKREAGK
jgi:large subunit ribosomal protein L29